MNVIDMAGVQKFDNGLGGIFGVMDMSVNGGEFFGEAFYILECRSSCAR